MKIQRRELLKMGAIASVATPQMAMAMAKDEKAITKIAWGSCANQDKEQKIWDAILERNPELFLFIGDNIYADTRDPQIMAQKYQKLANIPEFKKFRAKTPFLTIWDDHDYGENDAGGDYPMKEESRRQFCDFWEIPKDSPRRTREDGIYTSQIIGPNGKRVQIILPDLRYNRTPIKKLDLGGKDYHAWAKEYYDAGKEVPGPYDRISDDAASMLGKKQWDWLEGELQKPADIRIFATSLQYVADFAGWEGWINYYHDHQKLLESIRKHRANGLFCISGDTHYGEVSKLDTNVPYPIWDFTSSGITEVWPVTPPNSRRIGNVYRDRNFGFIEIDWNKNAILIQICAENGAVKLEQKIALSNLRV